MLVKIYELIANNPKRALKIAALAVATAGVAGVSVPVWLPGAVTSLFQILMGN